MRIKKESRFIGFNEGSFIKKVDQKALLIGAVFD